MKLVFSKRALQQVDRALDFIAKESPAGAANIERRLAEVVAMLKAHPEAGVITSVSTVRRIHLTPYPYLIDYTIKRDEVTVLRFRHTSRRPV